MKYETGREGVIMLTVIVLGGLLGVIVAGLFVWLTM